jgi:hypothetical protein
MKATVFEIIGRPRVTLIGNADISDFELKEVGQVPAVEILENIHITLYTLDLENGLAVFVETPPEVDLCYAPFYYVAQFENATRVMTISFETMIELAKSVVIDESRLVFIHSVGRSGSTLAGQIFAQVVGVVNISEPDALTIMVIERFSKPGDEETVKTLLDAVVRLLCKDPTEGVWVIKGRSFVIELADWLDELYPKSKHVFLYRAADQYVVSAKRAFVNYDGMTAEEIRKVEITTRAGVGVGRAGDVGGHDPDCGPEHQAEGIDECCFVTRVLAPFGDEVPLDARHPSFDVVARYARQFAESGTLRQAQERTIVIGAKAALTTVSTRQRVARLRTRGIDDVRNVAAEPFVRHELRALLHPMRRIRGWSGIATAHR